MSNQNATQTKTPKVKQPIVPGITEISEYKGKPILVLKRQADDKFPFQFGLDKALLLLANIDSIKTFVADESAKQAATPAVVTP